MRQINMGVFKVNDMEIGSTITVNQSFQRRFYTSTKKNQGFGENGSDGSYFEVNNGSFDQDVVDSNQYARGSLNKRKGT